MTQASYTVPIMLSLTQPWATLIASVAVLLSALVAASVARYNRRQADRHFDDKHELDRIESLRARYTTAAEQLAHESAAVRLAGVYAIASLADDWHRSGHDDERQVCIDLLRAYVRTPVAYSGASTETDDAPRRGEIEVRQSIVQIMSKHRCLEPEDERSWATCDTSMANARLDGVVLTRLDLSGMNLGSASLRGAQLVWANLTRAYLGGACLDEADLSDADLTEAHLSLASFTRADLSDVCFRSAWMIRTDLSHSRVPGANFQGAKVQNTKFTGAVFFDDTVWPEESGQPEDAVRLVDPDEIAVQDEIEV